LPADSEERKWLIWVKENPGRKIPFSAGKARSFEREGWIVVDDKRGSRRAGPLMRKFVRPHDRDGLKALLKEKRQSFKAANEFQFLETLSNSRGIPLKDLLSRFSNGATGLIWFASGKTEVFSKLTLLLFQETLTEDRYFHPLLPLICTSSKSAFSLQSKGG